MKLILMLLFVASLYAAEKKEVIKTSAVCDQCEARIEKKLKATKGIVKADLNYETGDLSVEFSDNKITKDEIKQIVSEIGYDADDVKANPKAHAKLPKCCKVK